MEHSEKPATHEASNEQAVCCAMLTDTRLRCRAPESQGSNSPCYRYHATPRTLDCNARHQQVTILPRLAAVPRLVTNVSIFTGQISDEVWSIKTRWNATQWRLQSSRSGATATRRVGRGVLRWEVISPRKRWMGDMRVEGGPREPTRKVEGGLPHHEQDWRNEQMIKAWKTKDF